MERTTSFTTEGVQGQMHEIVAQVGAATHRSFPCCVGARNQRGRALQSGAQATGRMNVPRVEKEELSVTAQYSISPGRSIATVGGGPGWLAHSVALPSNPAAPRTSLQASARRAAQ